MRYPPQGPNDYFRADLVHVDGQAVVAVSGEIDLATCEQLWAALENAIAATDGRLVIDMTGTTFMSATGLRLLIQALDRLDGDPGSLVLRSPPRIVRLLLRLSGIEERFTIEEPGRRLPARDVTFQDC